MDFFLLISLVILIFSAILHEVAHGFVAEQLGDPTARLMGRLTLNPQKHIDLWMSIILPLILFKTTGIIFGAAKPVPVDPFNLKDGRKDMAIVSLAGPLTNLLLAVTASIGLRLLTLVSFPLEIFVISILVIFVKINLLLAILNLLPVPPTDGSKVFALLLPEKEANAYLSFGSIGIFIIFFLLINGSLEFVFNLVNLAQKLLLPS